jgi:hypothetical protein
MIVEPLTQATLPAVLELLAEGFREMEYAGLGLSFDRQTTQGTILHPSVRTNVARVEKPCGRVLGASVFIITPSLLDARQAVAAETAWHSDPKLPKPTRFRVMAALLRQMLADAQKEGVTTLRVNPPAGFEGRGLRRLLVRYGFALAHVGMVKPLCPHGN